MIDFECIYIYKYLRLDEERIREITQSLSEIETLARVLDAEHFKGTQNEIRIRKSVLFCFQK